MKTMNYLELTFCEKFEAKSNELLLLTAIKDNLTEKGRQTMQSIQNWIDFNMEKYLEITGK